MVFVRFREQRTNLGAVYMPEALNSVLNNENVTGKP